MKTLVEPNCGQSLIEWRREIAHLATILYASRVGCPAGNPEECINDAVQILKLSEQVAKAMGKQSNENTH